jgi:hypothetical protein
LDDTDEIVRSNPTLFEPAIEQAAAAPGERRRR